MAEIGECCDDSHPCLEGQGDCDNDAECLGVLVCGADNCDRSKFPTIGTNCCEKQKGWILVGPYYIYLIFKMWVLGILYYHNLYSMIFFVVTLGISVTKLKDESCSSRGYRMAETKSECEDIAQRLGLLNTEATSLDIADCNNQGFYRCAYDSPTKLFWIPNCADNGTYGTNVENLCVSGN